MRATALKTQNRDIVVRRLDERRYAIMVDGIVRYVGSEEECQRRLAMLAPNQSSVKNPEAVAQGGGAAGLK
jgi:hypothetical protein